LLIFFTAFIPYLRPDEERPELEPLPEEERPELELELLELLEDLPEELLSDEEE
jgi:hypothetical protein